MASDETFERQQVLVNKAILYAALLSTGGFALASWPPDQYEGAWWVDPTWFGILVGTAIILVLTLRSVWRLERETTGWL